MKKSSKQILLEAANLIRTKGHCKGDNQDETGAFCTYGAINMAAYGNPLGGYSSYEDDDAADAAKAAVRIVTGQHALAVWNDSRIRTPDDVIRALESAAEKFQ